MRRVLLVLAAIVFWAFMSVVVPAQTTEVETKDNVFAPESLTVGVGATVTFKNTGKLPHTATAEDESFDTGNINAGQSKSITLKEAGTFKYICIYHETLGMVGTIIVEGEPSPEATPTAAAAAATGGDKDSGEKDAEAAEAPEAPRAVPPSEKYFPMLALAMLVGGLGLVGLSYLKTVLKTAERGR